MNKIGTIEASRVTGLSRQRLSEICKLKKIEQNHKGRYSLYLFQWQKILSQYHYSKLEKYCKNQNSYSVDVIYVHTTWEIRESKLNFMEL